MPNVYLDGITLNLTDEAFKNKKLVRALEERTLKEALQDPEFVAALEESAAAKPDRVPLKMHRRWRRGNMKRLKKDFDELLSCNAKSAIHKKNNGGE